MSRTHLLSPMLCRLSVALVLAGALALPARAADDPAASGANAAACPMAAGCPFHGMAMPGMPARAALGITLADRDGGPVDGPVVAALMPGGGAEEAGLEVGDVLTEANGESLAAESPAEANRKLVRLMATVNPGEEVRIGYRRDGKTGEVRVEARPVPAAVGMGTGMMMPPPGLYPPAHRLEHRHRRGLPEAGAFRGIRLATLTEGLGRYFGTSEGLLVLRSPKNEALPLQDGDVILEIAGRKPTGLRHALRILGSYAPGEQLTIKIRRDDKPRTLSFVVPEDRDGRGARPTREKNAGERAPVRE